MLLEAWHDEYGSEPIRLKRILEKCSTSYRSGSPSNLCAAISDLVPVGRLNSRSFATILQKFVNQWLNGYRLQKAPQSAKSKTSAKWYVERQEDAIDASKP